jgi:hypothetical protein
VAGPQGAQGIQGPTGPAGQGVPTGGTDGQILTKTSSTDYATAWEDLPESAAVVSSATPPENTNAIWFNTENGTTYIYYDSYWTSISGDSGAPIISDTAPSSPVIGMEWFNSSNGKSYIYYSDAWVELDSNGTATASTGNVIINGAFEVNQRGFTSSTTNLTFGFDRWRQSHTGGTTTVSAQSFTPGAAPLAGQEGARFVRITTTGQTDAGHFALYGQKIESVRTFAGQTVTLSFYARAGSGTPSISNELVQNFGNGGSPSAAVLGISPNKFQLTTSWQRFTATFEVPSIASKTLGTSDDGFLELNFFASAGSNFNARTVSLGVQNNTFDIWGVQLESGPVATPFRRNAPSIQAELAACHRYYVRYFYANNFQVGIAVGHSTNQFAIPWFFPTEMRVSPTLENISGAYFLYPNAGTFYNFNSAGATIIDNKSALLTGGSPNITYPDNRNSLAYALGNRAFAFNAEL